MPQIFKIGEYRFYFWANEGEPLEPVHIHISEGIPTENSTKIWITKSGKALLCNNNSHISQKKLREFLRFTEANSKRIIQKWVELFGEINYYC